MGLDVYLYKYADFEETRRKEKEYDEYSESLWASRLYVDIPEEEREEIRKKEHKFKTSLGIGDDNNSMRECIELPSSKYPTHQFKIGYFRSSYNDSGINRILDTVCGKTLGDIFKSAEIADSYYIKPNWENALRVTEDLILKLTDHMRKINVSVSTVDIPIGGSSKLPTSTKEALTAYIEEFLRGRVPFDGAYSNSVGLFSIKSAQKVKALIPGLRYSRPCVYIIHEETSFSWYIESLEIVKETIEYVLAQPDNQKYYFHWSA